MKKKFIITVLAAAMLTACSERPAQDAAQTSVSDIAAVSVSSSEIITLPRDNQPVFSEIDSTNGVVQTAQALLGTPFAEGGKTLDGFDNSGFIYYVLRENGYVNCPRMTDDQVNMGEHIGYDEMKSGDLVFFSDDEGSDDADFGGIYIGEGTMIYSSVPGSCVVKKDISESYWTKRFVTAVSLS